MEEYDLIVVGGSFAGLATAYFTDAERILVLEKDPELGHVQRSTCGTFAETMEKVGCEGSVLRTFDTITFHSSLGSEAVLELGTKLCTIDYRTFCQEFGRKLRNATVMTGTRALGIEGGTVSCPGVSYRGRVVADCRGMGAVSRWDRRARSAWGMEAEVEFSGMNDSVHIFFGKGFVPGGYGWIFPTGEERARIGVGGYGSPDGKTFQRFLGQWGVARDGLGTHGGRIPCFGLEEPTRDGAFVVGDAASQALPFSAEGIRKALHYGEACGRLVTKVLERELTLAEGLEAYRKEVYKTKSFYANLALLQKFAYIAPDIVWDRSIRRLARAESGLQRRLVRAYMGERLNYSGPRVLYKALRALRG